MKKSFQKIFKKKTWKKVIDFTKIKKRGIDIKNLLVRL